MLKRLSVENYALIDKLDIAFAPGLNIITGETGEYGGWQKDSNMKLA